MRRLLVLAAVVLLTGCGHQQRSEQTTVLLPDVDAMDKLVKPVKHR